MLFLSKKFKTRYYSVGNEPLRSKKFFKIRFIKNERNFFNEKEPRQHQNLNQEYFLEWQKITKKLLYPFRLFTENISKFLDFHAKPLHLWIISIMSVILDLKYTLLLLLSFIGDASNQVRTIEDLKQKQIPEHATVPDTIELNSSVNFSRK